MGKSKRASPRHVKDAPTGSSTLQTDTFYGALAKMAEELRHTIISLSDGERLPYVQHRVAKSEVVFGVWPDPQGPGGFGFHLIKGRGHLAALKAELPDELTTTAIPCVGIDQAIAAAEVWGEPPTQTPFEAIQVNRTMAKAKPKATRASKDGSGRVKRERATRH